MVIIRLLFFLKVYAGDDEMDIWHSDDIATAHRIIAVLRILANIVFSS